tara:strand:- start:292 stop:525 length:234 start_codon:yes stop_codon:yes gene_type:complete
VKKDDKYAPRKYKRSNSFDSKKADQDIKYCKKCKRCWEVVRTSNSNKLIHYKDFPTYKRIREICSFCVKKIKGAHAT